MLNYGNSEIKIASLHLAGNRSLNEGATFAEHPLILNEVTNKALADFLMAPFVKQFEECRFGEHSLVKPIITELFESNAKSENDTAFTELFHEQSKEITDLVYEASDHPHIHRGEVMVAYINGLMQGDCFCDGICIVKFEQKENFLFTSLNGSNAAFSIKRGSRNTKIDRAVLILNREDEEGYRSFVIDNAKDNGSYMWKERFLAVAPKNDKHYQTKILIDTFKDFVIDEVPTKFEVGKADQGDLIQRSINYLKANENFELDDFSQQVISQPEVIDEFKNYVKNQSLASDYTIPDEFEISAEMVKKQQKISKMVIALDKNFHIYIHGNKEMLEKGFDEEKGMHFYKLFFREEA